MEWQLIALATFGSLMILLFLGIPVAFAFMLVTFVSAALLWGGEKGLSLFILNMRTTVSNFFILPVPMFILLGEVMFESGMGKDMLDTVDKWLGRVPGRLGLVAVIWATFLAATTGVNMAVAALLGKVLLPEMDRRGYDRTLSMGCIMGPGGLAMIIPPSGLAVLLGALGEISIGKLLVGGVVPGLLMAGLMGVYIVGRCWLQKSLAPSYEVKSEPLSKKIAACVHLMPVAVIIFLVLGLMFLGIATPTEAAAAGAAGSFLLAAIRRSLTWEIIKKSVVGTAEITVMLFMIITCSSIFSQILAYTAVSENLSRTISSLPLSPILIFICIQLVLLFLGCFMDPVSIMMITLPIFLPIVDAFNFEPVWFGMIMLINLGVGFLTPPFGMTLFVMKGVAPPGTTMMEIYKGAMPFVIITFVTMGLIIIFPNIVLWLPNLLLR